MRLIVLSFRKRNMMHYPKTTQIGVDFDEYDMPAGNVRLPENIVCFDKHLHVRNNPLEY